ncbi:MAG TPA: L-threonylcarbamoyladenylate synthase [Coriobacteriia bacterium]|jgi:tRNA threonylcarbamoyl adenosine modification protein (Sua5/YciO/YrdC/YwlC family)
MSKVFHIDPENPSAEVINLAASVLRDGGVVLFPTETVYGIGASSDSWYGAQELFDIKMRPLSKPLPWLVEDDDALDRYGVEVPVYAHALAKRFWPGELTIVVKASDLVGRDFRDDRGTVALRCSSHEVVQELIRASGQPIASTSANTSGIPAVAKFEDLEARILASADVVLDAGEAHIGVQSTVVDCTGPEPVVVREGAIPAEEIMASAHALEN